LKQSVNLTSKRGSIDTASNVACPGITHTVLWNKGITKGGNNRIEIVKDKSEVLENGRRGRPEQDLTITSF